MTRPILHLGGNGHASARLDRARVALAARCPMIELVDLAYPGFEGRPRARSLDNFLDATSRLADPRLARAPHRGLRLRDRRPDRPRLARPGGSWPALPAGLRGAGPLGPGDPDLPPRLMRIVPARPRPCSAPRSASGYFRRRFARKHFDVGARPGHPGRVLRRLSPLLGLRRLLPPGSDPGYLRTLERDFALRPEALERITVWVGGLDRVVGLAEVRATERALGVRLPAVEFAGWGHYPMIDVPEEWADALCLSLAPAGSV